MNVRVVEIDPDKAIVALIVTKVQSDGYSYAILRSEGRGGNFGVVPGIQSLSRPIIRYE